MTYFKRFNKVFYKLFLSYITITIIITVLLGSTLYLYFSANYKKQLIKINDKILEHEKNTIELSVFKKVDSLYNSLSTQQLNSNFSDIMYFFDHSADGNSSKLYTISLYLKSIPASYIGLIDGIHIYIPNSNIIISSIWGIKYLDNESDNITSTIDWFKETSNPPVTGKWIDTRFINNSFSTGYNLKDFTYLRVYPMFSNSINQPGIIAIDLNEEYVSNIIRELSTSSSNNTFIINKDGKIIFHPNSNEFHADLHSLGYIKTILSNNKDSYSFITKIDGIASMVSYTTLKNTGWKLINITPVSEFYKQSTIIQQVMLILCISAILIGLILTNIFSIKMYNPLKALILLAKTHIMGDKAFTYEQQEEKENEYTIINNVINNLSFKVRELEKNIIEYQPIVKHNLLISLLNNTILSFDELSERLKIANIQMKNPYYYCMIIELNKTIVNSNDIHSSHNARYNIIKFIEHLSNSTSTFYAVELSCTTLGVIVNSREKEVTQFTEVTNNITSFSNINFNLPLAFSISACTSNPLALNHSYEEALTTLKYRFCFPQKKVILYNDILHRENNTGKISYSSNEAFLQSLKLQDMDAAITVIEKLVYTLITGSYSAEYCHKRLLDLVDIFFNYLNNLNLGTNSNKINLCSDFEKISDINEFSNYLISNLKELFTLLENRSCLRNIEIIEKVKEYIEHNLGNQLSLESAASTVNISPKYLSKLFRDIAGINFQDFVTEKRMEKSKFLLQCTDFTVEQISHEIGYNTPAYFIRQFKKTYGDTPYNYKKGCVTKNLSN